MSACRALCPRHGDWVADVAPQLSVLQNGAPPAQGLVGPGRLSGRLEPTGSPLCSPAGDQLGRGIAGRLQEACKKRGEQTGPSPVDRGKCGTALHLACDARAMPLGVVVTGANTNDGCQTKNVLQALVVQPPVADSLLPCLDPRDLPRAQADGAYGNGSTQERARLVC